MIRGYFDGAVQGSLNAGSIGAYLEKDDNMTIWEVSKIIGHNKKSIDVEYEALLALLHEIRHRDLMDITIYGDNKVVIDQLNHISRVRDLRLYKLCAEAEKLMRGRNIRLVWIPRNENKRADWLSKQPFKFAPVTQEFSLEQVAEYIYLVHTENSGTFATDIKHDTCSCSTFNLGSEECIHLVTAKQEYQTDFIARVA